MASGAGAYASQRPECCDIDLAADDASQVVNWKFVGEGKGEFELVQAFSFVGDKGSWQQEVVGLDKYSWFKKRKLCIAILAAVLLLVATTCAVKLFFGKQSSSETTSAVGASSSHERYDCNA